MGLVDPSAINTRGEILPYNSWAPNSVDLGGGTNLQNNLEVDGSPIGLGHKATVVPNTDDVQEVVVSTNSVDAESGHSAGGTIRSPRNRERISITAARFIWAVIRGPAPK